MDKKRIDKLAREVRGRLTTDRLLSVTRSKASLADIRRLIECKLEENFAPMQYTNLYTKLGREYCRCLWFLHELELEGRL